MYLSIQLDFEEKKQYKNKKSQYNKRNEQYEKVIQLISWFVTPYAFPFLIFDTVKSFDLRTFFLLFQFTKYNRQHQPVADNRTPVQPFDYKVNLRVGHLQFVALGKFYWEIMVSFKQVIFASSVYCVTLYYPPPPNPQ